MNTGPKLLKEHKIPLSEGLSYHINNNIPLTENLYRPGSFSYFSLYTEARLLYTNNVLSLSDIDKEIILETEVGEYGIYNGIKVPLDFPISTEFLEIVIEAKTKKQPALNKPKRGGPKKFYVFVRKPGGGIKKVAFGDTSGLSAKINNPEARKNFSKRHNCPSKKDKTTPGYWSCRLPRYAKLLGLKSSFSGFW
jgi:hypothetical protein